MRKKKYIVFECFKKIVYFFQVYCKVKEVYLVEIEFLDENNWIKQFFYRMGKIIYFFDIEM